MPKFTAQSIINANINDVFAVIIDVESYDQFVPYCTACEIIARSDGAISADMSIRFGFVVARYNSSIVYSQPTASTTPQASYVTITSADPIFAHMESRWILEEVNDTTKVKLHINIEFCNQWYDKLLSLAFDRECRKIMASFLRRLN